MGILTSDTDQLADLISCEIMAGFLLLQLLLPATHLVPYCLQASRDIENGNSSAAAPPVKAAKTVYLRQPSDAVTGLPAQMRGAARTGALPPSVLSRPASSLSQKGQDQHRTMLQVCSIRFPCVDGPLQMRACPLSMLFKAAWQALASRPVLCMPGWLLGDPTSYLSIVVSGVSGIYVFETYHLLVACRTQMQRNKQAGTTSNSSCALHCRSWPAQSCEGGCCCLATPSPRLTWARSCYYLWRALMTASTLHMDSWLARRRLRMYCSVLRACLSLKSH